MFLSIAMQRGNLAGVLLVLYRVIQPVGRSSGRMDKQPFCTMRGAQLFVEEGRELRASTFP